MPKATGQFSFKNVLKLSPPSVSMVGVDIDENH